MKEICRRHDVDHTGAFCGGCVLEWKIKAGKYDYILRKKRLKKKSNQQITKRK